LGGGLFVDEATVFGPTEAGGGPPGGLVEPGREQRVIHEAGGFAGEGGEDHLGYFLRAMRIAAGATKSGGVYEIKMAFDECGESVVGVFLGVGSQERDVIHGRVYMLTACRNGIARDILQGAAVRAEGGERW
jgi:hypothetical protein